MEDLRKQRDPVQAQRQEAREKAQEHVQRENAHSDRKFEFSRQESADQERLLRQPRSREYLAVFEMMDLLSATDEEIIEQLKENIDEEEAEEFAGMTDEEILEEIRTIFLEEFAQMEVHIETVMTGVLSKCYISGCDCHAITSEGRILAHFKTGEAVPEEYARGRIAYNRHPGCRCVEVYNNCCRVIMGDGDVLEIPNRDL